MIKKLFYRESFQENEWDILKENMKRGKVFSYVILCMELIFLLASFVFSDTFYEESLLAYRMHYFLLILGSGLFIIVIRRYSKSMSNSRFNRLMIYLALTTSLIWGASVTTLDLMYSQSMIVYTTFVFLTTFVMISRPDVSIFIYGGVQICFILMIKDLPDASSLIINSSIFVLFAWFVSRYQYFLNNERFRKEKVINEKNIILEKQNVELARLMMTDHLTGVYNRFSLDDMLARTWSEARSKGYYLSVLMIDIDDFKSLNDTFGHLQGDKCLKLVSSMLQSIADKYEGSVFRYGGDEFCLIFTNSDAFTIKETILKESKALDFEINGERIELQLSVGLYHEIPISEKDMWSFIEEADNKLYDIKRRREK